MRTQAGFGELFEMISRIFARHLSRVITYFSVEDGLNSFLTLIIFTQNFGNIITDVITSSPMMNIVKLVMTTNGMLYINEIIMKNNNLIKQANRINYFLRN